MKIETEDNEHVPELEIQEFLESLVDSGRPLNWDAVARLTGLTVAELKAQVSDIADEDIDGAAKAARRCARLRRSSEMKLTFHHIDEMGMMFCVSEAGRLYQLEPTESLTL
jgi:hypothetical protein